MYNMYLILYYSKFWYIQCLDTKESKVGNLILVTNNMYIYKHNNIRHQLCTII